MDHDDRLEPLDLVGVSPPRFCPRCGTDAGAEDALCPDCGETTREQGYCPVCERFLRGEAGTPCPKHDVPLGDGPPVAPGGRAVTEWVTVATYADALAAEAPRLRLEAEGIPAFLEGERMGRNTIYHVATGGVKLQVPREQIADARVLLSQTWAPLPHADDLDGLDDAWEDLAPAPWEARRKVMKWVILLILFGPLVFALVGSFLASLGPGG